MRVSAPTEEKAGCMLLLYALRDLAIGLYNLGSGAAIGRGFLKVDEISVRTPEGNALKLSFDSEGHCSVSDPSGILPLWRQALEEKK